MEALHPGRVETTHAVGIFCRGREPRAPHAGALEFADHLLRRATAVRQTCIVGGSPGKRHPAAAVTYSFFPFLPADEFERIRPPRTPGTRSPSPVAALPDPRGVEPRRPAGSADHRGDDAVARAVLRSHSADAGRF